MQAKQRQTNDAAPSVGRNVLYTPHAPTTAQRRRPISAAFSTPRFNGVFQLTIRPTESACSSQQRNYSFLALFSVREQRTVSRCSSPIQTPRSPSKQAGAPRPQNPLLSSGERSFTNMPTSFPHKPNAAYRVSGHDRSPPGNTQFSRHSVKNPEQSKRKKYLQRTPSLDMFISVRVNTLCDFSTPMQRFSVIL